jgi:hypothetical protein
MRKRKLRFWFVSFPLSNIILFTTALHLAVGTIIHTFWLLRGNQTLFRYYFGYQDPLFLVSCTVLELSLSYVAWKQFSRDQALWRAWLLIMISAFFHAAGMTLTHILSSASFINPLYARRSAWHEGVLSLLRPLGDFIAGPLQMITLAGGLFLALRLCRRFERRERLRATDWIVLGFVVAYTLVVVYVIVQMRWRATSAPGLAEIANWVNDPLLCVLLYFAFFLRRSLAQMGWGFVAKCWGAYVVAILGTSLASMLMWCANFGLLPYPESAIVWYIWPIVFAAYAMAPAAQVEAVQLAFARLNDFRPERTQPPGNREHRM